MTKGKLVHASLGFYHPESLSLDDNKWEYKYNSAGVKFKVSVGEFAHQYLRASSKFMAEARFELGLPASYSLRYTSGLIEFLHNMQRPIQ